MVTLIKRNRKMKPLTMDRWVGVVQRPPQETRPVGAQREREIGSLNISANLQKIKIR